MKQAHYFFQSSLDPEWDLSGLQSNGWPTFLRNVPKKPQIIQVLHLQFFHDEV